MHLQQCSTGNRQRRRGGGGKRDGMVECVCVCVRVCVYLRPRDAARALVARGALGTLGSLRTLPNHRFSENRNQNERTPVLAAPIQSDHRIKADNNQIAEEPSVSLELGLHTFVPTFNHVNSRRRAIVWPLFPFDKPAALPVPFRLWRPVVPPLLALPARLGRPPARDIQ